MPKADIASHPFEIDNWAGKKAILVEVGFTCQYPKEGCSDGEAVDLVLAKLSQLGTPRFVLTCRAADWRSATSKAAIRDHYGTAALELQIEPFDQEDVRRFLDARVGGEIADRIVMQFSDGALGDLLGNAR